VFDDPPFEGPHDVDAGEVGIRLFSGGIADNMVVKFGDKQASIHKMDIRHGAVIVYVKAPEGLSGRVPVTVQTVCGTTPFDPTITVNPVDPNDLCYNVECMDNAYCNVVEIGAEAPAVCECWPGFEKTVESKDESAQCVRP